MKMEEAKKVKAPENTPKSDALKNLETNLDQIMAFNKRINAKELLRTTEVLDQKVRKELASAPKSLERIRRELDAYSEYANDWLEFQRPALRWMSVMLVSFLEAYLEDGLGDIAIKNPRLVGNSKIEPMRIFEVNTIEEVRSEVRSNWAHDAIRPGGPVMWNKKLRGLGAQSFDEKVVANLQHLWDTRNLIVHSSCIADVAYAKKYEHLGIKNSVEVPVTLRTFGEWLDSAKLFVEWADKFFLAYGKKSNNMDAQN